MSEPRLSPRDKRAARLALMQETDQRQQQIDTQSQAAMLQQLGQLYGLQQQAERSPLELQALRQANETAQYGLERQRQLDPVQLKALQAQTEAAAFQHQWAQPRAMQEFNMNQANLDMAPEKLRAQQLANTAQDFSNQWAQPQAMLDDATKRAALESEAVRRRLLQQQSDWFDTQQQQEYAKNEFDLTKRGPMELLLGGAQIKGQDVRNAALMHSQGLLSNKQAQKYGLDDFWNTDILPEYEREEKARVVELAKQGYDPQGQPLEFQGPPLPQKASAFKDRQGGFIRNLTPRNAIEAQMSGMDESVRAEYLANAARKKDFMNELWNYFFGTPITR